MACVVSEAGCVNLDVALLRNFMAKILEVEQTSETERRGVTLRSCIIAALMSVSTTMVVNYVEYVVHASRMTLSHFPMGMLMLFLGLVLIVNPKLPRRYALSQIELVVVLAGGFVGGGHSFGRFNGIFLRRYCGAFLFCHTRKFVGPVFPPTHSHLVGAPKHKWCAGYVV